MVQKRDKEDEGVKAERERERQSDERDESEMREERLIRQEGP